MSEPGVQVTNLHLGYRGQQKQGVTIVEDVNFTIQAGEKFAIIGPSGCGKTTLLKAIAGFIQPLQGQILVKGQPVRKPGPDRAVVFQDFEQLFAWHTVLGNVVYALRATQNISKSEAIDKARFYLELVDVARAADKYPHMLSGGMKQRAALARALALAPNILLMDEPFGALDAITRSQLQLELNRIWEQTRVTIVLVTHSIQEAIFLGHHVMVMSSSPARIREIVDTSQVEDLASDTFTAASARLHDLLAAPIGENAPDLQLSAIE